MEEDGPRGRTDSRARRETRTREGDMGDIGRERREVEFEPLTTEPVSEPAAEPAPGPEPTPATPPPSR